MKNESVLAKTVSVSIQQFGFDGEWRNELGSTMEITVTGDTIEGTYRSAVSGEGDPISGRLIGCINGELISFTVNWPTSAITAWVGRALVQDGADTIETLWQMTSMDEEDNDGFWHSINAGADRFVRVGRQDTSSSE